LLRADDSVGFPGVDGDIGCRAGALISHRRRIMLLAVSFL
jgi:hypothetical protein